MSILRSFIFVDQLQPQTMCYLGTWIRGSLPRRNMAAQIIEVAPGLDIEALTDIALKAADVQGGVLVVERQFGYLEIHARDIAAVKAAAEAVVASMGKTPGDALKPKILASQIINRIDPGHAFLINRNKVGSMVLAGETLFVLETEPAAHVILAANAAEKAANIKIVDYRMIGATGRLYLSGTESDVRAAAVAAEQALVG
ncbi:BMC domain-containing protein [Acidocella sp. KAb 2-4]|uniref:BMC domain-containing protein n=1 Tax=Acidocella sp. KAb 2-4 TaxID=2885158 RepID=UPI001D06FBBF|nr:BMC domain-containing protein [Acidocella sp. KAb 2-4]MCB5944072.1 BMC domain-containing protein [Acidocella sp. KAb 2-4]